MSIGENIARLRNEKGLTQAELGKNLELQIKLYQNGNQE